MKIHDVRKKEYTIRFIFIIVFNFLMEKCIPKYDLSGSSMMIDDFSFFMIVFDYNIVKLLEELYILNIMHTVGKLIY